jgi:hypothetical protein
MFFFFLICRGDSPLDGVMETMRFFRPCDRYEGYQSIGTWT